MLEGERALNESAMQHCRYIFFVTACVHFCRNERKKYTKLISAKEMDRKVVKGEDELS